MLIRLITIRTAGVGRETILELAKHDGPKITFTGRNESAAKELIEEVKKSDPSAHLTFIKCDQSSLESVAEAAHRFLAKSGRLDILICNAGIMVVPPGLTKDGSEVQFGINFLAHALFVKLFIPILEFTSSEMDDGRIVLLTSLAYKFAPKGGIVIKRLNTPQEDLGLMSRWLRYGQSKLAMAMYATQIAKRFPHLTSVAIHPDIIFTGLVTTLSRGDELFVRISTLGQVLEPHEGA